MAKTATNNAQLTQKIQDISKEVPLALPHFAWYQYYTVTAPECIADPRTDELQLHCDRHNTDFTSRGRYLFYKGDKQSAQFCPECHYEFAGVGTKLQDIANALSADPKLGLTLSSSENEHLQRLVKYADTFALTCTACGQDTKKHKISNIQTHIKNGDHLCCQKCDKQKKGKSKRLTLQQAQDQVSAHQIDETGYRGFCRHCIHTCLHCGQRHWWTPQQATRAICTRCGTNGGMPLPVMPTLNDLNQLIQATSSWQLSTDKAHIKKNEQIFEQRFTLPDSAKIQVSCQQHPDVSKAIGLKALIHKLKRNACIECAAEDKSKYSAQMIEASFEKVGVKILVDLARSGLTDRKQLISAATLLTLNCPDHGTLPDQYTPYSLIRYPRDYKVKTPCRDCDPLAGNTLNSARVRDYVESTDRFKTHGAQYRLVDSNQEIDAQLVTIKAAGDSALDTLEITLEVLTMAEPPLLPITTAHIVTLLYRDFRKGMRGFMLPGQATSWLAKFFAFLNIEWQLGLQAEATFAGLQSEKGQLLRLDFYQPTLQRVYEVDGSQHVSEDQQIKSAADRKERFAVQQRRDKLVDDFFTAHSDIDLIRLQAYQYTKNNKVKALRIDQQYDIAIEACEKIYFDLYQQVPPSIDRDALLNTAHQRTSTFEEKLQRINAQYDGEFTAKAILPTEAITLCCKHDHYMQISNAKFYLDAALEDKSANALCWGCQRQQEIDTASRNLAAIGLKIVNEQSLRKQFTGTLDEPLIERGAKSKIILHIAPLNKQHTQANSKRQTITLEKAQTKMRSFD